jgi:hypothetical protein
MPNSCVEVNSEATRQWLQCFGWKPGLPTRRFNRWKYGRSDSSWREYCNMFACRISRNAPSDRIWRCHPARSILREFYGLEVHSPPDVKYLGGIDFKLHEAFIGSKVDDEIADLSDLVSDYLLPIGIYDQAHALIGVSGRVFASGISRFGVIYFGESFSEAMDSVFGGLPSKAVQLEDDRFQGKDLNCDDVRLPP